MATDLSHSSHWKLNSPIPADPSYENYSSTIHVPKGYKYNSPIPKDPNYDKGFYSNSPKPRVKPEALAIARNHQGKELAYLFNPAFKVIPIGIKPTQRSSRDYNKENFKKIKEIQRANKQKQVNSSRQTPVKAIHETEKYKNVESKVKQHIQTPNAPRTPKSQVKRSLSMPNLDGIEATSKVLHEKSTNHSSIYSKSSNTNKQRPSCNTNKQRPYSARTCSNQKKDIPKRPSSANLFENKQDSLTKQKSFIALNKEKARNSKIKRSPSLSALDDLKNKKENDLNKHKRGEIPSYLRNRKNEWQRAEEERIANLPDPTIPPGHTLMPEHERLKTLNMLKKSQAEMLNELQSLPVSRDTLRAKTRKETLEGKLREIDTALKIFSRPRVFIKEDE